MTKAKQDLWKSMTRKQRKVAIAKDVIAQIQAGKYRIESGSGYIESYTTASRNSLSEHFQRLKDLDRPVSNADVEVVTGACTMCARGAALMSRIRKFNSVKVSEIGVYLIDEGYTEISNDDLKAGAQPIEADLSATQKNTTEGLEGAFTADELNLIEAAFERTRWVGIVDWRSENQKNSVRRAVAFGEQFEDDSERLLAIMQNIVDNDGVFRPAQQYEIVSY